MDPEYKKERFVTLRIKESVVKKFRRFCKEESTSQSVTLEAMLHFFERHHARPGDTLPAPYKEIEQRILKRLNAVISIIRTIERSQTQPTVELLQSVFENFSELDQEPELQLDKKFKNRTLEEELRMFRESGGTF